MKRYQGEDIEFFLRIKQGSETDIDNWYEFIKVVVYFYTQVSHIAKFSTELNNLTITDDVISGIITSADTSLMKGTLFMDLLVLYPDGMKDNIKSVNSGIEIVSTPIKIEATI